MGENLYLTDLTYADDSAEAVQDALVNAAVSALYLRSFFNAAYAGLGSLPDGLQVKSSERSSVQLHCRPGGNAGGGAN